MLLPFATMLVLPSLVRSSILEKSSNVLMMMKMQGLNGAGLFCVLQQYFFFLHRLTPLTDNLLIHCNSLLVFNVAVADADLLDVHRVFPDPQLWGRY